MNLNARPDECERRPFHRGDANVDGVLDISDCLCLLGYLDRGAELQCKEAADANNDGVIDCADPLLTFQYLFVGGEPPAPPGPPGEPCGFDPDHIRSQAFLGCEEYSFCREVFARGVGGRLSVRQR